MPPPGFAQPRALRCKTGDEFTVLLCRPHHQALHDTVTNGVVGDVQITSLPVAREVWEPSQIHTMANVSDARGAAAELTNEAHSR